MNKLFRSGKKTASLVIIFSLIISCLFSTYAAANDKLVLELKVGSTSAKIDGRLSQIEKPYIIKNSIMIPLEWFTTTIGAEVNKKDKKVTEIIYGELNVQITTGSLSYSRNQEAKKLTTAPEVKNKSIMVPLDFISVNFPVTVTSDLKKGSVKIVLEDDGALSDLSFLTGGISSPKVGNSYYGWSLSVPSGSRIISNSFKSDKVGITNEGRNLYFEVAVENKNSRKLTELYNNILYNSTVRSSKIDLKATVPYFEYTRLSEYDEALRVRVFDKGDYFYYMTLNCYDNSVTPEKLLKDKYYEGIITSFNLNYKGAVKGVEDISKIKQGKANYYNYIALNQDSKYLPWSVKVPADWDRVLSNDDPMTTCLGRDSSHYMKVSIKTIDEDDNLDDYVDRIVDDYNTYFNKAVYKFISDDYSSAAGNDARSLKFSIKQADKVYIMDELYFTKGNIVYEITVKLPEAEHDKLIKEFIDTINDMTFYTVDADKFKNDIEKYNNKNSGIRVSQQDAPFEYINKTFRWSLKLPGFWTKSGTEDESFVSFNNPKNTTSIMVYSLEKSSLSKTLTDEEKFSVIKALKKIYGADPVKSQVTVKGYDTRTYTYKVESTEKDFFATVSCYCFEAGNYSYCYVSVVPELTATENALKEVDDIWNSFIITK